MDGNAAVAEVAYAFSDVCSIYPITPSSPMPEMVDNKTVDGNKNLFGQIPTVKELESEAGAAGTLHGALKGGALASTFTCSQGLLLMIPLFAKFSGEHLPAVIHVAARAVATHALSIHGDHSDIALVRSTGPVLLASSSVLAARHMAMVAHVAAAKARYPILHFMDGFRVSHTIQKVPKITLEDMRKFAEAAGWFEAVQKFRQQAMTPANPEEHGSCQGPSNYFAAAEASNPHYNNVGKVVCETLELASKFFDRKYAPYMYYGDANATDVIVAMGSGAQVCRETVEFMNEKFGTKVGVIEIVLLRPFLGELFLKVIPESCKRIVILDRYKDPMASAEFLYEDCATVLLTSGRHFERILRGRYGLSSTDFNPGHVSAIVKNMTAQNPVCPFTVGINDDVSHLSLPTDESFPDIAPPGTAQCIFWGIGSDGTIGANKGSIKLIANNTPLHAQGYFEYDSFKSGGLTQSYLRFGPKQFELFYLISHATFTAVHNATYLNRYNVSLVEKSAEGSVLLINVGARNAKDLAVYTPANLRSLIVKKKLRVFTIDGVDLATKAGVGNHINIVMQTAFFRLADILKPEQFVPLMKDFIQKTYAYLGEETVKKNIDCITLAMEPEAIAEIEIPENWGEEPTSASLKFVEDSQRWVVETFGRTADERPVPFDLDKKEQKLADFMHGIVGPTLAGRGIHLSSSEFSQVGTAPLGTSQYTNRHISVKVPVWNHETCIQCNMCSLACPHAVIRPYIVAPDEVEKLHPSLGMRDATNPEIKKSLPGSKFIIQVSPLNCTGCTLCVAQCPTANKGTLKMVDLTPERVVEEQAKYRSVAELKNKVSEFEKERFSTLNTIQLRQPLFEFSGACAGCGETPYITLVSRLFGERLIIANATGCSSIYGYSFPYTPYTKSDRGFGPAWANSLFEDNAEFGFGIALANGYRRTITGELLADTIKDLRAAPEEKCGVLKTELLPLLEKMGTEQVWSDHGASFEVALAIDRWRVAHAEELKKATSCECMKHLSQLLIPTNLSMLPYWTQFIIGGDGWAYDIGYGGLDHVAASGLDVNILILDTEVYSNTGGQRSKATPLSATARFEMGGKTTMKKDLAQMVMTYKNVYVAAISLNANPNHAIKALREAESYKGPSVVMCYSPCIEHGAPMTKSAEMMKLAVQTGYWPLYRYDPRLIPEGKNPFQLDSGAPTKPLSEFLGIQRRFKNLQRTNPEHAEELRRSLEEGLTARYADLKARAAQKAE